MVMFKITQLLRFGQDEVQGQIFSETLLVWIQFFFS